MVGKSDKGQDDRGDHSEDHYKRHKKQAEDYSGVKDCLHAARRFALFLGVIHCASHKHTPMLSGPEVRVVGSKSGEASMATDRTAKPAFATNDRAAAIGTANAIGSRNHAAPSHEGLHLGKTFVLYGWSMFGTGVLVKC